MTKEELTKLDNYGHKELKSLNEDQLNEYLSLLEMRRQEVLDLISVLPAVKILGLRNPKTTKVR